MVNIPMCVFCNNRANAKTEDGRIICFCIALNDEGERSLLYDGEWVTENQHISCNSFVWDCNMELLIQKLVEINAYIESAHKALEWMSPIVYELNKRVKQSKE